MQPDEILLTAQRNGVEIDNDLAERFARGDDSARADIHSRIGERLNHLRQQIDRAELVEEMRSVLAREVTAQVVSRLTPSPPPRPVTFEERFAQRVQRAQAVSSAAVARLAELGVFDGRRFSLGPTGVQSPPDGIASAKPSHHGSSVIASRKAAMSNVPSRY